MKLLNVLLAVVLLTLFLWNSCHHPQFPQEGMSLLTVFDPKDELTGRPRPCAGRDICVYIYLAPWCPHCREFLPNLQELRQYWADAKRPGLVVIIGNDQKQALEAMAAAIGGMVFLDREDRFLKALHVNSMPYFLVVKNKKDIIASQRDAMRWIDSEVRSHLK